MAGVRQVVVRALRRIASRRRSVVIAVLLLVALVTVVVSRKLRRRDFFATVPKTAKPDARVTDYATTEREVRDSSPYWYNLCAKKGKFYNRTTFECLPVNECAGKVEKGACLTSHQDNCAKRGMFIGQRHAYFRCAPASECPGTVKDGACSVTGAERCLKQGKAFVQDLGCVDPKLCDKVEKGYCLSKDSVCAKQGKFFFMNQCHDVKECPGTVTNGYCSVSPCAKNGAFWDPLLKKCQPASKCELWNDGNGNCKFAGLVFSSTGGTCHYLPRRKDSKGASKCPRAVRFDVGDTSKLPKSMVSENYQCAETERCRDKLRPLLNGIGCSRNGLPANQFLEADLDKRQCTFFSREAIPKATAKPFPMSRCCQGVDRNGHCMGNGKTDHDGC